MITSMSGSKPPTAKQLKNEEALIVYTAFLCSLIAIVILSRWLYEACNKTPGPWKSRGLLGSAHRSYAQAFHKLERRTDCVRLGRPSFGLILLVGIYVVGNAILCLTLYAMHRVNHGASRFGWLGAANMALCVFFGLKNTPLETLAHTSHTQLNIFHRIVGYATILLVFLHAVFYTIHFGRKGRWEALVEEGNIEGIGAGGAMLILLMAVFRHRNDELFYISHVMGFIVAVILVALHRPDWTKKVPVVMMFTFLIWMLDRIIRALRMCRNLVNNIATIQPLPDGGTRILLKKPCAQMVLPGTQCFLWIPRIALYENHPFTVVSNGPSGLELVIKSHQGFTKAIHDFATLHPGCTVWASIDGPYGSLPTTEDYDRLILIAGGSGAAFTFGLMNRIIGQYQTYRTQSIEFVWAVRRIEHISWFEESLKTLRNSDLSVHITIYITGHKSPSITYGTIQSSYALDGLPTASAFDDYAQDHKLKFGKMIPEVVFAEVLGEANGHERVLVAACGPNSLIDAVKDSADSWRDKSSLGIDLHCEHFDN